MAWNCVCKTIRSLCILAAHQEQESANGICITTSEDHTEDQSRDQIVSLNSNRSENKPRWLNTIVSAGIQGKRDNCSVYYVRTSDKKLMKLKKGADPAEELNETDRLKGLTVNLHGALSLDEGEYNEEEYKKPIYLQSGSSESKQSFFPLAVDDYFMSVAILSKRFSSEEPKVGACIVSNDSQRVFGIGYNDKKDCAEMCALLNAQQSHVDLTKCSLYTTGYPCHECTEAILEAGIRVVVHGSTPEKSVKDMIYENKACFKLYKCYIRIENEEKKFMIKLPECEVVTRKLVFNDDEECRSASDSPQQDRSQSPSTETESQLSWLLKRPSYRDFFMAMTFLAHTRSKDNRYQVGACLVTPAPHRLVAMGYNGMPDGRGFRDTKMDWGSKQSKYICHAELNAVIAAFRREADLSACTLYVTRSPCADCSKLIAQSGIKNVVFAKYYKHAEDLYKILGRLPNANITRYEYMQNGQGNIAKMKINLDELTVDLDESWEEPQIEWEKLPNEKFERWSGNEKDPKGRRDVDFPQDDYFMALAVLAKSRSPLKGKRVGACLVMHEPRRAISVGYNGYPDRCSEKDEGKECCAESNAILSAFRYHADLTKGTLYTTGVPCHKCATKIVQSGIKTVIYNGKHDMEKEAKEIFYWAKIATLEYRKKTKIPIIEIDLHGLTVKRVGEHVS